MELAETSFSSSDPSEKVQRALPAQFDLDQWVDWRWQIRNAFEDPTAIADILGLPAPDESLQPVVDEFVVRVTPYYLSALCDAVATRGAAAVARVARTFMPSTEEIVPRSLKEVDGMGEDGTHSGRVISKLYEDRALLFTTNVCPVYCRYCFRKRKVGRSGERSIPMAEVTAAIQDVEREPGVRDVIISGGEPLMMSDDMLVAIVERVAAISHVDIIRIDSKFLAVCPFRISGSLADRLVAAAGRKVLHFSFHFVHPLEVTNEVRSVTWALAARGIMMNAYTPLLRGVNDDHSVLKELFLALASAKVRPYYLVQNVTHRWNLHFQVPLARGCEIIDKLQGEVSGLALPQYIVYLPKAGGKIQMTTERLNATPRTSLGPVFRNHEGREILYYDPVESPR